MSSLAIAKNGAGDLCVWNADACNVWSLVVDVSQRRVEKKSFASTPYERLFYHIS